MVPDLKLEAIYFNTSPDFKLEFKLCGICNVRYLSATTNDLRAFLTALQKSVGRSRVIVTIGGFNGDIYLPKALAKAIGNGVTLVDKNNIKKDEKIEIVGGAVPLYNQNGELGGMVIEKGDQSIIMLQEDHTLRHDVLDNLVVPYIKLLVSKDENLSMNAKEEQPEVLNTETQEEPLEETESQNVPQILEVETDEIKTEDALLKDEEIKEIDFNEVIIDNKKEVDFNIEETEDPLRNIVLKKMDSSDFVTGSHDKAVNISEDTLLIEDEIYEGKHSKKKTDINIAPITTLEKTEPLKDFTVLELPSELDKIDELSFSVKKEGKARKAIKIFITILLVLIVILGSFFGYRYLYQPVQGETIYNNIISLYGQSSNKVQNGNILSKFGKLYELNSNIVGFVSVPNSNINYPVVKSTKTGTVYCETHLFDGTFNGYGTPYTYSTINDSNYNRNIVITGNTVKSGMMFSDLLKYKELDFYRSAPVINFDTIYSVGSYKVFSVLEFTKAPINYQRNKFFNDDEFLNFVTKIQEASKIKTTVDLLGTDNIITLVTKNEDKTVCVFARALREEESPLVDVSESEINIDPVVLENGTSSEFNGEVLEITEDNISGGRQEEAAPKSSKIEITASHYASSYVSSYVSSKISSKASSRASSKASSKNSSKKTSSKASNSSSGKISTDKLPTLYVTNNSAGGAKVSGSTLDILSRIVEAEMGSSYETEALKAQAVCKYSWLLCEGATNGKTYPGVAMKTASTKTINAVKSVLGIVARYNGKVAHTFCYAFSAGKTANAGDIWGGSYPWVKAVDSSVDKNASKFQTKNTYKAKDIAKWVKAKWSNINLKKIDDRTKWFKVEYDSNNLYAKYITIGGVKQRGSHLRTYVLNDSNCGSGKGLRSPAYKIKYNESKDEFTFTVKGYGHGAGLSQFGANQYAKSGYDYQKILKHYFTGIDFGISYGS